MPPIPPPIGPGLLRVVAAAADPDLAEFLRLALPRLGHRAEVVGTGPDLVAACRRVGPDVVVTAAALPGLDGLAAVDRVCAERPVPVVLVADAFLPPLVARAVAADWVLACLPWPVGECALGAAVAVAARRFARVQDLCDEVGALRQALEDRKVVERAKGAVMHRTGLPEGEAYRRMRKVAADANRKLADVARQILEADAVFQALGEAGPRH